MNVRGIDYTCVLGIFASASELRAVFSNYRASIAIWSIITNGNDKRIATGILKQQTAQINDNMQKLRDRVNSLLGTCLKVEIAVTKGTELLAVMIKADARVSSFAKNL